MMTVDWRWVFMTVMAAFCLVADGIPLGDLCREADHAKNSKMALFCETLQNYMNNMNQDAVLVLPLGKGQRNHLTDVDDLGAMQNVKRALNDMYFGIRQRRSGDTTNRVRRGGNYIRFGRSAPDTPNPHLADYLMGFGEPDKKAGAYVRFGRSTDEVEKEALEEGNKDEEKRFMRFGKREDEDDEEDKKKRFMRFGRGFMRFGRGFMRFGKSDGLSDEVPEKRFMRFGKREDDGEEEGTEGLSEEEKRFMRFGRGFMRFGRNSIGLNGKRYMRFGKKSDTEEAASRDKKFMRFGKRESEEEEEDKRAFALNPYDQIKRKYMRFGKRADEIPEDKRFLRFGKKFMRFGRDPLDGEDNDELQDEEEKRFMRFGKKDAAGVLTPEQLTSELASNDPEKRFMRFGKKSNDGVEDSPEKKFMRFGKKDAGDDIDAKRFMRFGRSAEAS